MPLYILKISETNKQKNNKILKESYKILSKNFLIINSSSKKDLRKIQSSLVFLKKAKFSSEMS